MDGFLAAIGRAEKARTLADMWVARSVWADKAGIEEMRRALEYELG